MNKQFGLKELPEDKRDFKLGNVFKLPDIAELPDEYNFDVIVIKDQKDSDFCTGFATTAVSELQEGFMLSPLWQFAQTKRIEGDHTTWGANLRDAMKSAVKYGSIQSEDAPFKLGNQGRDYIANWENWDEDLHEKAEQFKKKSYFKVEGRHDAFDNIRTAIWKFRDKKRAVVLGVLWGWPVSQKFINNTTDTGTGHAIACIGWNGEYLMIQNSYGTDAGDNGINYLHRNIINEYVSKYGAYMFIDIDKDAAKHHNDNAINYESCWLTKLIVGFYRLFTKNYPH